MQNHDNTLRKHYGMTLETTVRRIVRVFDKATPADIEAGASWYPEAGRLAAEFAAQSGRSIECCAAVISHLSPRNQWVRNVLGAHMLLVDKETTAPGLTTGTEKALDAINRDTLGEPVDESAFGPKTLRFYWNIMGDHEAVTVDVWALRVAGVKGKDEEKGLDACGRYEAFEHAFRLAAGRRSVENSTMQATTWVVQKGGRG